MLVLTRKKSEAITFLTASGERIEFEVIEFREGKVRLGFKAPPSVKIFRNEILPHLAERKAAA